GPNSGCGLADVVALDLVAGLSQPGRHRGSHLAQPGEAYRDAGLGGAVQAGCHLLSVRHADIWITGPEAPRRPKRSATRGSCPATTRVPGAWASSLIWSKAAYISGRFATMANGRSRSSSS